MSGDKRWMRRALILARRGQRGAAPNPMVGCVLIKEGKVVGEGYHARFGGPHAEAAALERAGKNASEATAYVTLEPCCAHPGKKTPPCADALLAAGISRLVVACLDPNPVVAGKGLKLLRRAGIPVRTGVLARQARRLNVDFFARMRHGRPHVILKTALSLDGQAYAEGGQARWITGPAARRLAHRLRADCDAVLVGIGTVLADDPALTSHGAGKDPLRVVLDRRLRTPRVAQLLRGEPKTLIFTASSKTLPGAETVRLKTSGGRLPLKPILAELARRGVRRLLIEGGPTVHASFLRENLVDEARVFIAPKLVSGSKDPGRAPLIRPIRLKRVGSDFLFSGKVLCSRG